MGNGLSLCNGIYIYIYIYNIYDIEYVWIWIYIYNCICCTERIIPIIQTIRKVGFACKTWIWLLNTMSKSLFHENNEMIPLSVRSFCLWRFVWNIKKVTDWRWHVKNNRKTHPHIFFSGNVISQTCGQIVPTSCEGSLHVSRASHIPYNAKI